MEPDLVASVRRFNRAVTQRIGALDDSFLSRPRPLGQSRVLWEIGAAGIEIRELRERLGLDSGYLSRLLAGLESDGLVELVTTKTDGRVRRARLTGAGTAEWSELERLSNAQATALLEPLGPAQRSRLVEAMATVERLLGASSLHISVADPASPPARASLDAYFAELAQRFESGFDPARSLPAEEAELRLPAGVLLLATLDGEPVACGALKLHDDGIAEVKRMWVAPSARGLGIGRRMLDALADQAATHGIRTLRLETNRSLGEAIGLYRSAGFREVPAFSDEFYAHHWFEKSL